MLNELPKLITLIGGDYTRHAAKQHTCWCCGRTIEKGEAYFRTVGKAAGRVFVVKHCRSSCETAGDMLDQNPYNASLRNAVFFKSLREWKNAAGLNP